MDIVTQDELTALVSAQDKVRETEEAVIRRLVRGAEVEAGKLVARTDAEEKGFSHASLEIEYAAETAGLAAVPKAQPIPTPELPEWLQGTHQETSYELTMYEDGGSVEMVGMDRAEYLALKVRLAELRGISLTQNQIDALDETVNENRRQAEKASAA